MKAYLVLTIVGSEPKKAVCIVPNITFEQPHIFINTCQDEDPIRSLVYTSTKKFACRVCLTLYFEKVKSELESSIFIHSSNISLVDIGQTANPTFIQPISRHYNFSPQSRCACATSYFHSSKILFLCSDPFYKPNGSTT